MPSWSSHSRTDQKFLQAWKEALLYYPGGFVIKQRQRKGFILSQLPVQMCVSAGKFTESDLKFYKSIWRRPIKSLGWPVCYSGDRCSSETSWRALLMLHGMNTLIWQQKFSELTTAASHLPQHFSTFWFLRTSFSELKRKIKSTWEGGAANLNLFPYCC